MQEGSLREEVKEFTISAALAALFGYLFDELKKHGAKEAVNRISEHPVFKKDPRGEIFEDIRALEKDGKKLTSLRRRLADAAKENKEYKLVSLLCAIPKTNEQGEIAKDGATGNRQKALDYLNSLNDKQFNEMMSLLDHDAIEQFLRRFWAITREVATTVPKDVLTDMEKVSRDGLGWIDGKMKDAAPLLGKLADRLESLPGGTTGEKSEPWLEEMRRIR